MHKAQDLQKLQALDGEQAKQYVLELLGQLRFQKNKIDALNFEIARLKQWRFGSSSESMDAVQGQLFDVETEQLLQEESKAEDRAVFPQNFDFHVHLVCDHRRLKSADLLNSVYQLSIAALYQFIPILVQI